MMTFTVKKRSGHTKDVLRVNLRKSTFSILKTIQATTFNKKA